MKNKIKRSPLFYVGDKYKLMNQIRKIVPKDINTYVEPFAGGGSSFLNTKANKYIVNDLNKYVIQLHKEFEKYAYEPDLFFKKLFKIIDEYGLSCSYRGKTVPDALKKEYKKTYYSKYNKKAYYKLRDDYNKDKSNVLKLYLLIIYGFNRMIRFNSSGEYNVPTGNVDFNKNVYDAIENYLDFLRNNKIIYKNLDYIDFLDNIDIDNKTYIYLDPPYLISNSAYNKLWDKEKEIELYNYLDKLDQKGIKFGISNLAYHKGEQNEIFCNWMEKYISYSISSNYISFNDNSIKENTQEVYVTNYESKSS